MSRAAGGAGPQPDAALPGLSGPWTASSASHSYTPPAGSGAPWTVPGRRAAIVGSADAGLLHAWIHPYRVVQDANLLIGGAATAPVGLSVTPEQVVRTSLANGAAVTERWTVALEHPVVVWQVDAPDGAPISLGWTVDIDSAVAAPECVPAADRRGAVLRWPGQLFQLIIDVDGGLLQAETTRSVVRISVRADGFCRVRLTGAADEPDLERSRQMLARRGFAGLLRQRADHAAELASYATSIETPEPTLVESFEWAKIQLDGLLVGTPGVGRCLVSEYPADRSAPRFVTEAACRVAFAQLAAGDRTGPRDTLKFLSLSQDEGGRVVEECSTGGDATFGAGAVPMYLLLAARYAAWAGELDFLSRRWVAIRRAFEAGLAGRPWDRDPTAASRWHAALVELQPLAEALGHPEVAEHLAAAADEARAAAGPATFLPEPAGLGEFRASRFDRGLDAWRAASADLQLTRSVPAASSCARLAVEGLWGVAPGALDGGVRVSPWFPPEWDSMSIERIRVGRTVLSVRMRRRFGQVAARVERVHGPRMHVEFALRGASAPATVQLDDVELGGGRVAFEADATHALVWHT